MNENYTSLCHPDEGKSCFFCCPPLRPPLYDPLDLRRALDKTFRENRQTIQKKREQDLLAQEPVRPINGWACWGLGYLDHDCKKAGCLLHPFQNKGIDYRHLIDYGTKCARELCLEARTFETLTQKTRRFYIDLTAGMDSFEYSSRKYNPIFGMLLWGTHVCEAIASYEGLCQRDREIIRNRYALLLTTLSYKTDGYLIESVVDDKSIERVLSPDFIKNYLPWRKQLVEDIVLNEPARHYDPTAGHPIKPVHLFPVPLSFTRFLKFSLNIWQATSDDVERLKHWIDKRVSTFV